VALPRFMSADEFLRVMDDNGVEKAHICTAETCPDLAELSRAATAQLLALHRSFSSHASPHSPPEMPRCRRRPRSAFLA